MLTVYIHGATATGQSFNYLRERLIGPDLVLEYDCERGFDRNLDELSEIIAEHAHEPLFFVGHSLGGIYSLALAERFLSRTQGGVTISTPYGGSEIAPFLKFFVPFNRLLKEIGPQAAPIVYTANIQLDIPWCNIVTTRGNSPWMSVPNDGVVTVESQRMHAGFDYMEVHTNHYEILMDPETVSIIEARRRQAQIVHELRDSDRIVRILDEDDGHHD